PPYIEVGNQAQRGDMLNRLVGGTILTQTDGVVREYENGTDTHQRSHAKCVAAVIGGCEEGTAAGNEATMERNAVHHGGHAAFTHAVVAVVTPALRARLPRARTRSRPQCQVGSGEIGRASDELRQSRRQRLDGVL